MTARRRPWWPALVVAAFTVVVAFGFLFAKVQADNAIRVAKRQAVAEAKQESERADLAICTIAHTNRRVLIDLLVNAQALTASRPPVGQEQVKARDQALAFYDEALRNARHPFPAPCDSIVLD